MLYRSAPSRNVACVFGMEPISIALQYKGQATEPLDAPYTCPHNSCIRAAEVTL